MINQRINQALASLVSVVPDRHEIEKIKDEKLGDFASNIAFLLAKEKKTSPKSIAEDFAKQLSENPDFSKITVGGNGFLNFAFSDKFLQAGLKLAIDENFGRSNIGDGQKVLVEYVSANPTGPLNVVNARAGALGKAIVNLLNYTGFNAKSEYLVNDSGNQVELLGASLAARIKELKGGNLNIPEGGYPGEYLIPIAKDVVEKGIAENNLGRYAMERIVHNQKESLKRFGLHFDLFIYESSIRPRNPEVLDNLNKKGLSYEKDGAVWFKAKEFGDIEDRVLLKRDGNPTYFLTDLTYHKGKFERGFERFITIWGPDHHGDILRLKGGLAALGFPKNQLEILICQETHLKRGEQKVSMSKRAGEYITLDDVVNEIGADALKFFLLMRKASQHLEFDLELAKKTSQENPVYYVQYAHARICNILKFAKEQGVNLSESVDFSLLQATEERNLAKTIIYFPDIIEQAALSFEPHRLIYFALDIASNFHYFYERQRVVTDNKDLTQARIHLCQCTQKVLAKVLSLIGVAAPEKM